MINSSAVNKAMQYKITCNLHRISLHDSSIVNFECSDDSIILKFDWAYLADYKEENLKALVLGNCELKLLGIQNSFLEKETDEVKHKFCLPDSFPESFEEILKNVSKNDNELRLEGFMTINGCYLWISWQIEFEKFEFSWSSYVTHEEWKQGSVP